MIRRFVLIAPILAISWAQAAICPLQIAAEVPLFSDSYTLNVLARINGIPARFIVDTGSEGSLITPDAATRLGLLADHNQATVVTGVNGREELIPNVIAPTLEIGAIHLTDVSLPSGALPSLAKLTPPIIGIIGTDLMQYDAVEFDLSHNRLVFWSRHAKSSRPCTEMPIWPRPFAELKTHRDGGRLLVEFKLDGRRGLALLDSGARSHLLSWNFANRMGVNSATLAHDPGGIATGVDLNARAYHWHKFATFELIERPGSSPLPIRHQPVITVAHLTSHYDMLLGADWFDNFDVWISFPSGKIFARPTETTSPEK